MKRAWHSWHWQQSIALKWLPSDWCLWWLFKNDIIIMSQRYFNTQVILITASYASQFLTSILAVLNSFGFQQIILAVRMHFKLYLLALLWPWTVLYIFLHNLNEKFSVELSHSNEIDFSSFRMYSVAGDCHYAKSVCMHM